MIYDKTIMIEMPLRNDGKPFLTFLPKQMEVLVSILLKRGVLYSGAFRAGKTLLLVNAAIMACLENPGIRGMLVSQVSSQLKNAVFDLLLDELKYYQQALDDAGIGLKLLKSAKHSPGDLEVVFHNGSKILFRSCRTHEEQRKLASITLDFYGIDEPVDVDELVFTQLSGRISGTGNLKNRKVFGILTTNPGSETHWLYKYFFLRSTQFNKEGDLSSYWVVETTTYDNALLPDYDDYIREQEALWDEDWVRRYLNGKWGMFEGQVFKTFNPDRHVKPDLCGTEELEKGKLDLGLPVKFHFAAIDWGLRDPHCLLIGGVTEDNRIIVKREIYDNKMTSHNFAKQVAEYHKLYNFRKIYVDPSAADLTQQLYDLGLPSGEKRKTGIYSYANNDINYGISKLNTMFKNDFIIIDYDCTNLKKQISGYRYKYGTDKPDPNMEDHAVDTLRYLITDYEINISNEDDFEVVHIEWDKWG